MYCVGGDKEAVNVSLLMPLVHKADLSRTEIQVLIDVLLNKQQGSSVDSTEWIEVLHNAPPSSPFLTFSFLLLTFYSPLRLVVIFF